MWRKIRTIFTFKMKLTNFCDVIYCIKKCFFLLIWIWIFFLQARKQELNNRRVYLIPAEFFFSLTPNEKNKMELFPFGSLVLILILLYLNLLSFTFNSFAPWKKIFYLKDLQVLWVASFIIILLYYFWSCTFFTDVLECVFVSVFFWCCCFDFSFFCICLKYLKYIFLIQLK